MNLLGVQTDENLMEQGQGCTVDVLKSQSMTDLVFQHVGTSMGAGIVLQQHNTFQQLIFVLTPNHHHQPVTWHLIISTPLSW